MAKAAEDMEGLESAKVEEMGEEMMSEMMKKFEEMGEKVRFVCSAGHPMSNATGKADDLCSGMSRTTSRTSSMA
jgi:hypothetical protein